MTWLFWSAAGIIAYTYVGYALWLWLRGRVRPKPIQRGPELPFVSIVMVVRNEAEVLACKLRNLMSLDYPAERLEIVVVSDGSSDATQEILSEYADRPRFRALISPQGRGKASGLNEAIRVVQGPIVLLTDARQELERNALRYLVENFADPTVGCVSGELMLGDPHAGEASTGMGLYWRVEKKVRELESASGSVVGATGALYAARRELLVPLPPDTILDDVYLPMHVARQGARVVFDGRARAWDAPNLGDRREFARKVRTLSGNYQLLQLAPWLLTGANPLRFEFVCHKLLRLLMPFALVLVFVASLFLDDAIYNIALGTQIGFYFLSVLPMFRLPLGVLQRTADAASTFVVLNAAALVAFVNFITRRPATWVPLRIGETPAPRPAPSKGGR
jgi:biofilm PGA synthesis N-glycosyltransferase PgaC